MKLPQGTLEVSKCKVISTAVVQGLQTLSVKSNFDVRGRKIGQISKVGLFS